MAKAAKYLGFDLSTTALSVGIRDADGNEDFHAVEMRGAVPWHGQPAHKLQELPGMIAEALDVFSSRDWSFSKPGTLSFSVRQHDMALLGEGGALLAPALSWECSVAKEQVAQLNKLGVNKIVGKIEERFILPKLMWALAQEPDLREQIERVVTTGDYVAGQFTGEWRLSTSDALSNALLCQSDKSLATEAFQAAGLPPKWFPLPIPSGEIVGTVSESVGRPDSQDELELAWHGVRQTLANWQVAAGLGDNHAGAVGLGLADDRTMVISAGSSGTVVRAAAADLPLRGEAVCFEYYDQRLLLMMLHRCARWYNDFCESLAGTEFVVDGKLDHTAANEAAAQLEPGEILVLTEPYPAGLPDGWDELPAAVRIASTQFSIAGQLLLHAQAMAREVADGQPIESVVLTGGLNRSPFFQGVLLAGLKQLLPAAQIRVSARDDQLAFQSATYGAVINAMLEGDPSRLPTIAKELCPTRDARPLGERQQPGINGPLGELLS